MRVGERMNRFLKFLAPNHIMLKKNMRNDEKIICEEIIYVVQTKIWSDFILL